MLKKWKKDLGGITMIVKKSKGIDEGMFSMKIRKSNQC